MTLQAFVTHKINKIAVGVTTLVTAAIIAFGGLTAVGAQATGTYQCGTYGGGDYNQTDCTDTPTGSTGGTSSGSTGSAGSTSTGSSSSGSTSTGTRGSTSSGSASTGTGSSTSTGTTATETPAPAGSILLNAYSEYRGAVGKSLDLKKGAVIYFNLKGQQHSITIKSIDAKTLVITIASTPTDVSVPMGTTVNHDTDGDGTDDIAITYGAISTDEQTVTGVFRALGASTADVSTQSGSTGSTSTGATAESSPNMMWIFIIPIVLGLAIIVTVVTVVMKRRKANAGGGNFTQF